MKSARRNIMIAIFMLSAVLLTAASGFGAATGFEDDAGGPQGLAIQGSASGEKLAGVVFLELFNFETVAGPYGDVNIADGYAVVRLRKAGIIETLYTEISDVPTDSPASVQEAIMNALAGEIKLRFFNNDQAVTLVLRTAEEFGSVDIYRGGAVSYIIADIVIAGK